MPDTMADSVVDCASFSAIFLSSIISFSPTPTILSNESPFVLIYEITDFSTSHFARTIFHIIFQFTRVATIHVTSFFLSLSLSHYLFLVFSTSAASKIQWTLLFCLVSARIYFNLTFFTCCPFLTANDLLLQIKNVLCTR